ncbi:MAG: hypothetical protein C0167_04600 [Nitrososphaera sp.]|nr:MAG: hypothetical protein C0167_04600 [Nitrososphaera sp.]
MWPPGAPRHSCPWRTTKDASPDSCASGVRRRSPTDPRCPGDQSLVYGSEVDVGDRDDSGWQHRGIGRMLMDEAERVAREEWNSEEVLVTSAVGTREYYRRLGYSRKGPYMAKRVQRTTP